MLSLTFNFRLDGKKFHSNIFKKEQFFSHKKEQVIIKKTPEIEERMEYELKIIKDKGYASYFLVVSDLLRFAHENGILTTIRGSVAGSLVTYLAGITNVDPILYMLPFERFLNPERPSAPDIDMDIADDRRDSEKGNEDPYIEKPLRSE